MGSEAGEGVESSNSRVSSLPKDPGDKAAPHKSGVTFRVSTRYLPPGWRSFWTHRFSSRRGTPACFQGRAAVSCLPHWRSGLGGRLGPSCCTKRSTARRHEAVASMAARHLPDSARTSTSCPCPRPTVTEAGISFKAAALRALLID